jgi:hypothetical protein
MLVGAEPPVRGRFWDTPIVHQYHEYTYTPLTLGSRFGKFRNESERSDIALFVWQGLSPADALERLVNSYPVENTDPKGVSHA